MRILLSSFSVARERSKESFSESEPARCSPTHLPGKTAHRRFSHVIAVFPTRASLPRSLPPIPSSWFRHLLDQIEIVGYARERDSIEGFQFRCTSTMIEYRDNIFAPKLIACAVGIESARYDFERFLCLLSFSERK